jgi:hypothetical protein
MRYASFVLLLAAGLLAPPPAAAQGTAEIRGRVLDQQSAVLPGASITIRNQETGTFRETVTGADGSYFIAAVPPGRYTITAELAGFRRFQRTDLVLEVGKTTTVELQLQVGGLEEAVTVQAESPLVNTTTKEIGGNVTSQEMAELPSFNRNFISYISLLPGIVPTIATDSFGADSIEVNGQDSRNNNYLLDGANNVDDFNGARSGMQVRTPILAVQELRVRTNQFDAQYGRTSGAVVDAISKSGTNRFRGEAFTFLQDAALTSRSFAVKRGNLEKPDTAQRQYGGDLGGPIIRDKLHFYGNVERVENDRGVVMTFPSRPELNYTTTTIERVWNTLARVDHQINSGNSYNIRWMREQSPQDRQAISGRVTQSAFDAERDVDTTLVGNLTSVFGSTKVNTLRLSFTREDVTFASPQYFEQGRNQAALLPQLSFQTYTDQQQNGHQARLNDAYQVENVFSWFVPARGGSHDIRTGFQFQHSQVKNFNEGNLNGTFSFGRNDLPFDPANPRTYPDRFSIRIGGPLNYTQKLQYLSAFFQDHWKATSRLTVSLGARWDAEKSNFPQRSLEDFGDIEDGEHPTDWNNVSPRIGFSYDVSGDGKQALRGGYGTFFQRNYLELNTDFFTGGLFTNSFTVNFPNSGADPGPRNGRLPTDPFLVNGPFVTPELLALVNERFPPGSRQAIRGITIDNPDRHTPYNHQMSVGYERQLGGEHTASVDYVHTSTRDLIFTLDLNQGTRATTDPTSTLTRPNPNFNDIEFPVNLGRSEYDGLNLSLVKRMSHGYMYRVSYAIGYGRGNHNGQNRETSPFQFEQDLNLDLNEGPVSRDRRHNLSVSGAFAPAFLHGVEISGVYRYLTGTPFTLTDSDFDEDRNDNTSEPIAAGTYTGQPTNSFDRAYTVDFNGRIRGARGPGQQHLDLRAGYSFRWGARRIGAYAEFFNVMNRVNFGTPNGDFADPDFLVLDSAAGGTPPRTINFFLRVSF